MTKRILGLTLAGIAAVGVAGAAEPGIVKLTWEELQTEVSKQKLAGHNVTVDVSGVGAVKTRLVRIEPEAMIVESKKPLQQWASGDKNARIPAASVTGFRVNGKKSGGGTIGALTGLAAGVGLGIAAGLSGEEGHAGYAALGAAVFGGAGYLAGYFAGNAFAAPYPYFLIVRGDPQNKNQASGGAEVIPPVYGVAGQPSYPPTRSDPSVATASEEHWTGITAP